MKKYFCLVILLLAFFPSLVFAQTYSQEEIEKGSYIIGKYLFNKNKTSNYDGTLTTPMIMLASKTIDSNNLEDMKIYFKNSRGRWINAITGQAESNVPSSFEIICINLDCQNNNEHVQYAYDVYNKNDVANGVYLIGNYLFNKGQNNIYDGTLTTPMIMLASKSIESNSLSDMVIYYKNSRGRWVNAINGQVQDVVPDTFKIGIINLVPLSNPTNPLGKKDSIITLSETSGTIVYGETRNIPLTFEGDGEFSCLSSDNNIATCSVSGTMLTITPKASYTDSSIVMTIVLGEGTNYNETTAIYTAKINRQELVCPSSPSNKTFNNTFQQSGITCPTGSATIGLTSAKDAGTYTQTCIANPGYKFNNTCSVEWTINKKDSTLSFNDSYGLVFYNSVKYVPFTKEGDGELSCSSSNTNVATCSINNNILSIVPKALNKDNADSIITLFLSNSTNYNDKSIEYIISVNRNTIICPSSPDNKIFNNTLQQSGITCPEESTAGGVTSATAAGTYIQTCTAKPGYKFDDQCKVVWSIVSTSTQKLNSTLTLSESSGTTTYGNNKTVTITKVGDGELSCISSNENIATCSVSGTTLTITPQSLDQDNKQATITILLSEGETYYGNSTSYDISVNRNTIICPSSPSSKTFNNTLQQSEITCPNGSITGGDTSATNAGTYTQTCTAKNGYKFENECSVNWNINKKESNLGFDSVSATLKAGQSKNVTINTLSDGTISCESSNTAIATCSVNDKTLTITGGALNQDNKQATITVTLQESDNYLSKSADYSVIVNRNIISTCPSSPSNKTFNNKLQQSGITCPEGSTAGGVTSATDAGTYTQTCVANAGYKFNSACSVDWTINKKSSTLTLDSTSGTTTYGTDKIVSITKVGDGELSCTSSNENIATCSIDGTTLTITPQALNKDNRLATINVSLTEGNNYLSNSTAYKITVDRSIITTCPSSPSNKIFNNTLQQSGITCPNNSTAGGVTSATDAGTYTQTCTANIGYKFDSECSIDWTINKKNSTLTLDSTSSTIYYGQEQTVSFTKEGDGELSCLSSDNDIATCSISGTTLTITPQSSYVDSSIVMTLVLGDGTNYNGTTAVYTATVIRPSYSCVIKSRFQKADGSYAGEIERVNKTVKYGDECSWNFAGNANYQAASFSEIATSDISEVLMIDRHANGDEHALNICERHKNDETIDYESFRELEKWDSYKVTVGNNSVFDDYYLIRAAHECANKYNKAVVLNESNVYNIYKKYIAGDKGVDLNQPVVVATNTDFNGSTFYIHDENFTLKETGTRTYGSTICDNYTIKILDDSPIFNVVNIDYDKSSVTLSKQNYSLIVNNKLKAANSAFGDYVYIKLTNWDKYNDDTDDYNADTVYRIVGDNVSSTTKTDVFRVRLEADGTVTIIDKLFWDLGDYDHALNDLPNKAVVSKIPDDKLLLKNGNFITVVSSDSNMVDKLKCVKGNTSRNMAISRSNIEVSNMNYHFETDQGVDTDTLTYGYTGFYRFYNLADVVFKDSTVAVADGYSNIQGNSIYGLVMYDVINMEVNNVSMYKIRRPLDDPDVLANVNTDKYELTSDGKMMQLTDKFVLTYTGKNKGYWGVTGTDNCKSIVFDNVMFNRIDSHASIMDLTVKNSTIGVHSITITGTGDGSMSDYVSGNYQNDNILILDNVTVLSDSFVALRNGYGSTWNGTIKIKNGTLKPIDDQIDETNSVRLILWRQENEWYSGPNRLHNYGYNLYLPYIEMDGTFTVDTSYLTNKTVNNFYIYSQPSGFFNNLKMVRDNLKRSSSANPDRTQYETEYNYFVPSYTPVQLTNNNINSSVYMN